MQFYCLAILGQQLRTAKGDLSDSYSYLDQVLFKNCSLRGDINQDLCLDFLDNLISKGVEDYNGRLPYYEQVANSQGSISFKGLINCFSNPLTMSNELQCQTCLRSLALDLVYRVCPKANMATYLVSDCLLQYSFTW